MGTHSQSALQMASAEKYDRMVDERIAAARLHHTEDHGVVDRLLPNPRAAVVAGEIDRGSVRGEGHATARFHLRWKSDLLRQSCEATSQRGSSWWRIPVLLFPHCREPSISLLQVNSRIDFEGKLHVLVYKHMRT